MSVIMRNKITKLMASGVSLEVASRTVRGAMRRAEAQKNLKIMAKLGDIGHGKVKAKGKDGEDGAASDVVEGVGA